MDQLDFNLEAAVKERDQGMRLVAHNNSNFLRVAREIAMSQARIKGEVTADDIRRLHPWEPSHPNVWGCVFKCAEFEPTGRYRRSELKQGHGNLQIVWRLANYNGPPTWLAS